MKIHHDREKEIEVLLKKEVEALGGLCWKFVSPGTAGVPDRIVMLDGNVCFVELKKEGQRPRAIQQKRIDQIKAQDIKVEVLDSREGIKSFISTIQHKCKKDHA